VSPRPLPPSRAQLAAQAAADAAAAAEAAAQQPEAMDVDHSDGEEQQDEGFGDGFDADQFADGEQYDAAEAADAHVEDGEAEAYAEEEGEPEGEAEQEPEPEPEPDSPAAAPPARGTHQRRARSSQYVWVPPQMQGMLIKSVTNKWRWSGAIGASNRDDLTFFFSSVCFVALVSG